MANYTLSIEFQDGEVLQARNIYHTREIAKGWAERIFATCSSIRSMAVIGPKYNGTIGLLDCFDGEWDDVYALDDLGDCEHDTSDGELPLPPR
jgi:hypothetical protein